MRERPPSCKGSVTRHRVQLFTVEIAMAKERRYVTVVTVQPVLSYATQVRLDPSMEVSDKRCCLLLPLKALTLSQRGEHDIHDCVLKRGDGQQTAKVQTLNGLRRFASWRRKDFTVKCTMDASLLIVVTRSGGRQKEEVSVGTKKVT